MTLAMLVALLAQVPDAARIEAAVRKAGERRYRLLEEGKPIGSLVLKTSVDRTTAVFEDVFDVTLGGQKMEMAMKETALLKDLSLRSASRKGRDGADWTLSVADRKAMMKVQGRSQTIDLAGATLGEQAVFRMICAAERKEGTTFKLDVLNFPAEELQKGRVFKCGPQETFELGGKKVPAFKWTESWESQGLRNGVPVSSKVNNIYWVSPDGVLLGSTSPHMDLVLETE
jgi:hypothetical protein